MGRIEQVIGDIEDYIENCKPVPLSGNKISVSKEELNDLGVLKSLRDLGNTVIVVEHDEDIMKAADYIIDIGPEAGTHGGEVVAAGTYKELLKAEIGRAHV